MKLCIDCKWHRVNNNLSHICINKNVTVTENPVTGEIETLYNSFCSALRTGASGTCGPEGKWFEEKEPTEEA